MDFTKLGDSASRSEPVNRPVIAGRVLQADADFFCYYCARIDEHPNENFKALLSLINNKRVLAGCEFVNVHLTLGIKGGREQMATVKEYQGQRNDNRDPAVKQRVHLLRNMLANYKTSKENPVVNLLQEADDSLTQYQNMQITLHGVESSVLMSGDKDLWMVEGLHCDPDTGRMWRVQGYGKVYYKDVGNVTGPKLIGEGTSWFWHQMIMGDTADNIPGLPMLSGRLANRYVPTKVVNVNRPPLKCGEAKAVAVLKDVTTDLEAFRRVREAYKDYYGSRADEMLYEQAFLLWMRRTGNVHDVMTFLKTLGFEYTLSKTQQDAMARFKELALLQISQSKVNQ